MVKHTASPKGFTLIELMVTLTIVATVLSAALITMRGYIPKQRLISTQSAIENLLQRAQSEASARSYWTCVSVNQQSDGSISMSLLVDKDGNHGNASACGNTGDIPITSITFKTGVTLANPCTGNVTSTSCAMWFDTTGSPKVCAEYGGCGVTAPGTGSGCADASFQIVTTTSNLDSLARAREVEAITGGLIQSVKPGLKGLANSGLSTEIWAKAPDIATGTGACE